MQTDLASHAKKMTRKIESRRLINASRRSRMRTFIRQVEEAIASGDAERARQALQAAQPEIMRAASHGIIHKNTASRKVSRLAQRVRTLTVPAA
jgi:small subunit ribosomal protein S20